MQSFVGILFLPFIFQKVSYLLFEVNSEAGLLGHPLFPFGAFKFLADVHDIVEKLLAELASDVVVYKLGQEVDAVIDVEGELQASNALAYGLVFKNKILIV